MRALRVRSLILVGAVCWLLLAWACSGTAHAQAPRIPEYSTAYRLKLEREVASVWGLDAPVAGIAAQIHQESRWRDDAQSAYAIGLMQFTPATADWMGDIYAECAPADPWDADWSMRCGVRYDRYLYERAPGATECDRWAFTLSDYNGGGKWRKREQALARAQGVNDQRWFRGVDAFRARAEAAHRENRSYVTRILLVLWPLYSNAGWPGEPVCTQPFR